MNKNINPKHAVFFVVISFLLCMFVIYIVVYIRGSEIQLDVANCMPTFELPLDIRIKKLLYSTVGASVKIVCGSY